MSAPEGFASFPGCTTRAAEIPISRGITPAVGILRIDPVDGLTLNPGTLRFVFGNQSRELPDCLPLLPNFREVRVGNALYWDIDVLDHRWRWQSGAISGEYNIRLSDGSVEPSSKRTPRELATLLLNEMGESGFDVSKMPADVWPYCRWENTNPARALASLVDAVACTVTGGEVAKVVIWPLGVGGNMPSGAFRAHPTYRFGRSGRPSRAVFVGGATLVQSKLKLAAIAQESDGDTVLLADASYKPNDVGFDNELPFTIPSPPAADRPYAQESMWRWFRVAGQADGSLSVPGIQAAVSDVAQYLINDFLLASSTDPSGVRRPIPAYVEGTFWPYSDDAVELEEITRYVGPWRLRTDRLVAEFPLPIFGLSDEHAVTDPELYLTTSYRVREPAGNLITFVTAKTIGGNGGDFVIRRPEVFVSVTANYSPGQPTSLAGVTTTTAQAQAEADRYLALFQRRFTAEPVEDQEFAGIWGTELDGLIAQVKLSAGGDIPTTRIGRVEEFDIYSPSSAERRRREVLEQLREIARL